MWSATVRINTSATHDTITNNLYQHIPWICIIFFCALFFVFILSMSVNSYMLCRPHIAWNHAGISAIVWGICNPEGYEWNWSLAETKHSGMHRGHVSRGCTLVQCTPDTSRGHFSPNNSRKTSIGRPLGLGMGVFRDFEVLPKFQLEVVVMGVIPCYIVPRYNESI